MFLNRATTSRDPNADCFVHVSFIKLCSREWQNVAINIWFTPSELRIKVLNHIELFRYEKIRIADSGPISTVFSDGLKLQLDGCSSLVEELNKRINKACPKSLGKRPNIENSRNENLQKISKIDNLLSSSHCAVKDRKLAMIAAVASPPHLKNEPLKSTGKENISAEKFVQSSPLKSTHVVKTEGNQSYLSVSPSIQEKNYIQAPPSVQAARYGMNYEQEETDSEYRDKILSSNDADPGHADPSSSVNNSKRDNIAVDSRSTLSRSKYFNTTTPSSSSNKVGVDFNDAILISHSHSSSPNTPSARTVDVEMSSSCKPKILGDQPRICVLPTPSTGRRNVLDDSFSYQKQV
jgi:hypothetical protein